MEKIKIIELKPVTIQEELRERISEHDGKLGVVVHPFHAFNQKWYTDEEKATYKMRIEQLLRLYLQNRIPCVIFEDEERVEALRSKLETLGEGNVYIIPTRPSDPRPASFDLSSATEIIRELGANEITLSGSYLSTYTDNQSNGIYAERRKAFHKAAKQKGLRRTTQWTETLYPTNCVELLRENLLLIHLTSVLVKQVSL